MRIRATVLAAATVAVVLVGCGSGESDSTGAGSPTTKPLAAAVDLSKADFEDRSTESAPEVDAVDNLFKPPYIIVKAGTTVTFRNDGRNNHNVFPAVEGTFDPLETDAFEPGTESTITFDEAGDYPYYCTLHGTTTKGMVGAIRVVE
ncbi:MAG: cupredoxin domain-containing protein [Actinobacteria bacterium]|nr:cupredoxin domain-containing protein [Actinomycetota bacterium]